MRLSLLLVMAFFTVTANATNYPCSGKKGGIDHCVGEQFLCRDGSISASKRICNDSSARALSLTAKPLSPTVDNECNCRSGKFCTGPRGGTFCYSDNGSKSYFRK
ncbi:hypothetical protein PPN31114_03999 [Pandoraea pneumonica]|uniref:PBCV-specific basic adaptor domain-containing protein n=1 Tax=Pandoraea pneumonica TaxID=2508299 RepID=A0A5E4XPG8_9BURK|nr:hypothetical protein PPN31114_03999 [Pandoraea pneumonica]